jgi:RimJ/RimL family protein N-acetyltransferase
MMQTELTGNLVHLRPLGQADLTRRAEWTADDELVLLMGADPTEQPFVSPEDEQRRTRDWFQDRQEFGDQLYAIEVNGRYIGDIDVEFFPEARKAEMSVFIGDRTQWGKGYGSESVRLVLEQLRSEPEFDRVEVGVPRGNDRALGFWQRLGFQQYATDDDGTRWFRLSV